MVDNGSSNTIPFREEQPCGDLQGPSLAELWAFASTDERASALLQDVLELHLHVRGLLLACQINLPAGQP